MATTMEASTFIMFNMHVNAHICGSCCHPPTTPTHPKGDPPKLVKIQ